MGNDGTLPKEILGNDANEILGIEILQQDISILLGNLHVTEILGADNTTETLGNETFAKEILGKEILAIESLGTDILQQEISILLGSLQQDIDIFGTEK